MLNSLFGRISLAALVIFIALSALLVSSIDDSARALQQEAAQKLHLSLATNVVKESPILLESGFDAKAIENAFHMMMVLGPALELYVVSPHGELLHYSDPDGKIVRSRIAMEPLQQFLEAPDLLPILGDDPRSPADQKIFSAAPIYAGSVTPEQMAALSPMAYLYIIIGGQQYDSVNSMLSSSHFAQLGIRTIAAGAVFFVLVLLILFFVLTRPLRTLATGLAEFRDQNYLRVPASLPEGDLQARDELNQLTTTISAMARRIVAQFDDLLRNRKLRQELLTHISHDLRTPLASIRGYLESWQINRTQQSEAEALHCIEIALKNCDQLEHMVDELFELARLDANEITPEFELFPLHELVDDIMQKFALRASSKQIQLVCDGPDTLPLVRADIGHINRVFSNLLDNAIRHSKPHSQIVIAFQVDHAANCVRVRIVDSGSGIPAAEIPLLFEPYFRASNQDKHYRQGTGLGLAITKRLLALHGADISVSSQERVGSVFCFDLPLAR